MLGGLGDGGSAGFLKSKGKLTDNKWHFVVLTLQSAQNLTKMYIDGEFIGEDSNYATPLKMANNGTNSSRLEIGARSKKWRRFEGLVDEVMIWDRVLSDSEIMQVYRLGGRQ